MNDGLKIHVSPVQSRPYPHTENAGLPLNKGDSAFSLANQTRPESAYLVLTNTGKTCGNLWEPENTKCLPGYCHDDLRGDRKHPPLVSTEGPCAELGGQYDSGVYVMRSGHFIKVQCDYDGIGIAIYDPHGKFLTYSNGRMDETGGLDRTFLSGFIGGVLTAQGNLKNRADAATCREVSIHRVVRTIKDEVPNEIADIKDLFRHCPHWPCIYFLCKNNRVVYVGQSTSLTGRLNQHANTGKDFDEVFYVRCHAEKLDKTEKHYIEKLNPPLNRAGKLPLPQQIGGPQS